MEKLTWAKFKPLIDSVLPPLYSTQEDSSFINIFCIIQGVLFDCDIDKNTNDYTEFQSGYRAKLNMKGSWDASGRQLVAMFPFSDASGFRFRGVGFSGTALANSTTSIDFKITQDRYINGGNLLVNTVGVADKIKFQVIDKDDVLGYGLNVVLDEFITDYFVPDSGNLEVKLDYPARVLKDLYIRLIYINTESVDKTVKCNLYLHMKTI